MPRGGGLLFAKELQAYGCYLSSWATWPPKKTYFRSHLICVLYLSKLLEMEPTAHQMPVSRTAHFYSLGTPSTSTKRFWFVCHGYGQLAQNFIRKFDQVAGAEDYVVAPEGLSRFYWGGLDGPVAASWMTRGDRLDEIKDFTAMLSVIFQQQLTLLSADVEIILFGFSQGCATQVRWLMQERPRFDQLWLWAGFIPEDLNYGPALNYLADKPIHHFLGNADPLLKPIYVEQHQQLFKQQKLEVQEHGYVGDHRVIRSELDRYFKALI